MALAIIDKYSMTDDLSRPKIKIRRVLSDQERDMFVSFFVLDDLMHSETKTQNLCIWGKDCRLLIIWIPIRRSLNTVQ